MREHTNFHKFLQLNIIVVVILFGAESCSTQQADMPLLNNNYAIASPVYTTLAEKSLDLLTSFEFDSWAGMMSDSIEYEFPDGDINSRTKLIGKSAVLAWWKNYKATSGIQSMTVTAANYLPIHVLQKPKDGLLSGIYVYAYFSNNMVFKDDSVALRMNFNFHFNKEKMIDRIITYYDRTPIIEVSGNNFLNKK